MRRVASLGPSSNTRNKLCPRHGHTALSTLKPTSAFRPGFTVSAVHSNQSALNERAPLGLSHSDHDIHFGINCPFWWRPYALLESANILDYSPSVTPNQEAMDPRQVGVERRAELEAEYNRRQADAGRVEWRIATGKLAEMPTRPPGQPSRLLTEVAQRL